MGNSAAGIPARIGCSRASGSGQSTFTFNYSKALKLQGLDANILLRPGDTVLVR